MSSGEQQNVSPVAERLVREKAASRVHAKDASLYAFSEEAQSCARDFMGWTDLASHPPLNVAHIQEAARGFIDAGFEDALLIGQGGSTQAAMTLTKFDKDEREAATREESQDAAAASASAGGMRFHVLDSDSPVRLRGVLERIDPLRTVVIAASKSGTTLEMKTLLAAVTQAFSQVMSAEELARHLVAITDPGTELEQRAHAEGWAAVLHGEATVGGRFSALSVFGLFPAALVGISLDELLAQARAAEVLCGQDSLANPAIQLAAFLFEAHAEGRNKLAYVSPKRGRALGLWIEQLVAESTGKDGKGILPYIETDPLLLAQPATDRAVLVCRTPHAADVPVGGVATAAVEAVDALIAERDAFEAAVGQIDASIPQTHFEVTSAENLAAHFVIWEYATALCGYLMEVCPFDQPDVASAKACVSEILRTGVPAPDFVGTLEEPVEQARAEDSASLEKWASAAKAAPVQLSLSPNLDAERSVRGALRALFESIKPGDYFALNAFVPFAGAERKVALERMRHAVAHHCGVVACLEIGPRYLHSTGQLQKGGANQGVFLVLSGAEPDDIALGEQPAASLGTLEHAQAAGDGAVLMQRGRRCLYMHLFDNSSATLRRLADLVCETLAELETENA